MAVTISYKNSKISEINNSNTRTLETAGKYCESNIIVNYNKEGNKIVEGNSYIVVTDAEEGDICALTQYGVCEQDSSTNAISCNNGVLSISSGEIITTGTSETVTIGSQTATIENLYSVENIKDEQEIVTGRVTRKNDICIYDGTQPVGDRYISSTGAKDNGAIIIYPREEEYTNENIISFNKNTEEDINSLEVNMSPIQSLNGYSKPWPAGGGKNLWDTKPYKGLSYNIAVGTTVSLTDGAAVDINGNEISYSIPGWGYRNFKTKSLTAGTYRVYLNISEITSPAISVYNIGSDNVIKKVDNYRSGTTISTSRTIADGDYIIVYVSSDTAQTIKITDYQIEAGSSHTDWEPYSNICPITGRTGLNVYRTGFNLCQDSVHTNHFWESGVLKTKKNANYAAIDIKVPVVPGEDYCVYVPDNTGGIMYFSEFDESESYLGLQQASISNSNFAVFTATADTRFIAVGFYKSGGVLVGERICVSLSGPNDGTYEPYQGTTYTVDWSTQAGTVYGGSLDVVTGVLTVDRANIASYNGEVINEPWLSSMDAYAAGTTPTIGAQVVYPLATPVTYQLTPQEVVTLVGQNNIFSPDATSIKVAVSNPRIDQVTPQPLTLVEGNNTITATNLNVSSVPLELHYSLKPGISCRLLAEDEVTVNTTSTSITNIKEITVSVTNHYSFLLFCEVRDKAGPRNGYFYGATDIWSGTSGRETTNVYRHGTQVLSTDSSGLVKATSMSQYGVWAAINSRPNSNSTVIKIASRYNASYSGTINGTYSVKIYEVAWPGGTPFS